MSDKPILFSSPMIKALLDGRKTQTRRILKPQPKANDEGWDWTWTPRGDKGKLFWTDQCILDRRSSVIAFLPYQVGDRLWVREAWRPSYGADWYREDLGRVPSPRDFDPKTTAIEYLADGERELGGKNRPGIHMPRWASRITLLVKDVRVERLQEISGDDAVAEGITVNPGYWSIRHFRELWTALHGPGSWEANPFVVVISFSVILANIDAPSSASEADA